MLWTQTIDYKIIWKSIKSKNIQENLEKQEQWGGTNPTRLKYILKPL